MQAHRQRALPVGQAYCLTAAFCRIVKSAHVPADRQRFFCGQPQKPLDQKDTLLPVSVRKLIVDGKIRHFLPNSPDLCVPGLFFIKPRLAQIVKQPAERHTFFGYLQLLRFHQLAQALVYMKTVGTEPAFLRQMVPGGSRRREKVPLLQPRQQLVAALPGHAASEDLPKFLLIGHKTLLSFLFYESAAKRQLCHTISLETNPSNCP